MNTSISNIIICPLLTEKSNSLSQQFNKYVFKVSKNANKLRIKKAIEKRFKVKITKVSTISMKGKKKNTTVKSGGHVLRTSGYRESWKKAIITLHADDKLNLVEGEF
jgi:large subunit ribosomal protein L23